MDYLRLVTDTWGFGSDEALAQRLRNLVLSGKKTATTGLFKKGDKQTMKGEYAAILDGDKKPFCIIQYTNSFVKPFLEVDWEFAKLEGEDYRDLEDWRNQHRDFFKREYGLFSDDSLVICDQFVLVEKI